jgi:hypothetical protein
VSSPEPLRGAARAAYVAHLIPGYQREGFSAEEALADLRSSGLGIRRQTFLRAWGASLHAADVSEALQTSAPYHVPQADEITQVPRPKARGFQYNVDVLMRDPSSGAVWFAPTSVITPTLVTHLEAIEQAAQGLKQAIAGGRQGIDYGEVLGGGTVTDVLERVPEFDEAPE